MLQDLLGRVRGRVWGSLRDTFRDAFSGGTISVYHVSEKGWTKMSGTDVGELHFKYYPADPVEENDQASEGAAAMET